MMFLPTVGLAQSIYPGSSAVDFAVNIKPEMKAEAFPLRSVRLLPGFLCVIIFKNNQKIV